MSRKTDIENKNIIACENMGNNNFNEGDIFAKSAFIPRNMPDMTGIDISGYEKERDEEEIKRQVLIERQKEEEKNALERIKKAQGKREKNRNKKAENLAKAKANERKKEGLREYRIKKREERLARRDLIKHESELKKEERKIREQQMEKEHILKEQKQNAEIRAEKDRIREIKRMKIANEKRKAKNDKRQRGLGGWVTAVVSLALVSMVLATMLVWNRFMPGNSTGMLSSVYSRNYYDLVDYVDNLDVNLSKIALSEDNENRQKILGDIILQANLAEENLSALPIREDSRNSTIKFVNQVGDFGKYLNNKLIDGGSFSEKDVSTLYEMRKINRKLKTALDEITEGMGSNFNFASLLSGEENNILMEKFNELENHSVEYPKMIYDGPFADKEDNLAGNKKYGKEISEDEAISIVKSVFSQYSISDCKVNGMAEGENFNVYNIEAKLKDDMLYAQVSVFGDLVEFNVYRSCKDKNYNGKTCIKNATEFLNKLGYKSIKPVWTTENDSTVYINFASVQDGIILYSDLIKMSVCMADGLVSDMDGVQYTKNHKKRNIPKPLASTQEAEGKLSESFDVKTSRLALIPATEKEERLAYEFYGCFDDGEYYIYIDAITLRELKIFKVIESGKGTLLL